ncbi:MAG: hypothetical protein LBT34_03980 [Clostridiales Family XIII bacterium]|jgi:hypothetical protein|nr:hypothetical protein [Clostridiales Family XIII bacterium]
MIDLYIAPALVSSAIKRGALLFSRRAVSSGRNLAVLRQHLFGGAVIAGVIIFLRSHIAALNGSENMKQYVRGF